MSRRPTSTQAAPNARADSGGRGGSRPDPTLADPGPEGISTNAVLFGQVVAPSPVSAVVRRLRTAIALGLFGDGDRLPREAELVRRLGVTNFSVREALGILRAEGLITTRSGNSGGSFVSYGTDRKLLTTAELRRMTSTELRDLGDWRQMLVRESASLAAQRASESNVLRLTGQVDRLASAETELEARRAHGRFHIELAAAAQSTRMTRAELGLYEEFEWLLGAALNDQVRRKDAAKELAAIASAVAARSPSDARLAAENHTSRTVDALVKLRLALLAVQADPAAVKGRTLAEEVSRIVALIASSLDTIAARTVEAMSEPQGETDLRARLWRGVMSAAADLELDGLGFIAEPGVVPGSDYWIAWWQATPDGLVVDDSHVLDPKRDDFYDYTTYDFFTIPKKEGRLHAQGPYVDYGGTNDYTITFSRPVTMNGTFIGVAAADVPVATLERQVAPWLAISGEPCRVINAERRVIVANVAGHSVGDVLPQGRADTEPVAQVDWFAVRGQSL